MEGVDNVDVQFCQASDMRNETSIEAMKHGGDRIW